MIAWLKSSRAERPGGAPRSGSMRLVLCISLGTLLIAGCAVLGNSFGRLSEGVGYYWQTISGHLSILQRAEPVGELLAQGKLDPRTRERLEFAKRVRRFAVTDLGLPDNGSYTRFADLKQPFVTWGVVASPELSLRLTQWCFPVAGCVTYRGYYSLEAAERYAAKLQSQGLDVQINGVPAYSTLGWLDDPLLSTFINYPDAEVARLVFHELSHQVVYVPGDSMFNESFASTVEQLGVERWLGLNGTPEQRLSYRQQRLRRDNFLALLSRYRDKLAAVYAARTPDEIKREGKRLVLAELKGEYQRMREGPWAGFTGYDRWFSRPLGNAHLGSVATYTTWVPVFRQLFDESGEDFRRFYLKVGELASLDRVERQAFLVRRSDKLMGDTLPAGSPEDPVLHSPDQARASPALDRNAPALATRDRKAQESPARDQVLHLRDEDAVVSPDQGQVHAREQSTGATIRTYQ
jgi:predicted aminopeptidase